MDETKQKIITLFKARGTEIPTSEILDNIYPEYIELRNRQDKPSKRKLAQLHRKLLYHINELVNQGILRFTKFGEKGSKFFALSIGEGEEITELTSKFKKKMTISKPLMPSMPIETYEHQGIILRYESSSWVDRLNSLVINSSKINTIKELSNTFEKSIDIVNDCICLESFNEIIEKTENRHIMDFIEKMNDYCIDYKKRVSCIINTIDLKRKNSNDLRILIEKALEFKNNITFIYNLDSDEVQEKFSLLEDIINLYIKKRATIYIKNKKLHKSAYFIGTAGPYSLLDNEEQSNQTSLSIACGQTSLIVDVEKFYSIYGLDNERFSQLMINISKSFLSANSIQRRKSKEYFKEIINLDKKSEKEFLEFSRNYIRFWNFGIAQPGLDQKLVLNMLSEARKKVEQFALAEETIYKSCGMPLRFKIALSCAFRESEQKLSPAKFKRFEISSLEELYKPKIKKEIIERESLTELFNGGNDITFHRNGSFSSEDILREISIIINTYKLPLFSYNFENLKGDMKITSFLS